MNENKISTGNLDFTKWIEGGYEKDVITMIAGPPGCGKTNFCFLVCCSQAKKITRLFLLIQKEGFLLIELDKLLEKIARRF